MVLPIGFFAPLPLPMMIPFMGIQSAVMAEQFGTLFQYGKRRISAMSNEEFNKLTPQMLQERMTRQIEGMIPEMEKQIQAMAPLVKIILREFGTYIRLAGEEIVGTITPPIRDTSISEEETRRRGRGAPSRTQPDIQQFDTSKFQPPAQTSIEIGQKDRIDTLDRNYQALVTLITEARKSMKAKGVKAKHVMFLKKQIMKWFASAQPLAKQLQEARTAFQRRFGFWY